MQASEHATARSELTTSTVMRQDGTVRQILVQDEQGRVHFRGYFLPGTGTADTTPENVRYHWADAFTDFELATHYPELDIPAARQEADEANHEQRFVHKGHP